MSDDGDFLFHPLVPAFAVQHDLRERFLHALQEILEVQPNGKSYKAALEQCRAIAMEAIDTDAITEWFDRGRPLPWLDEVLGDVVVTVEDQVRTILGVNEGDTK